MLTEIMIVILLMVTVRRGWRTDASDRHGGMGWAWRWRGCYATTTDGSWYWNKWRSSTDCLQDRAGRLHQSLTGVSVCHRCDSLSLTGVSACHRCVSLSLSGVSICHRFVSLSLTVSISLRSVCGTASTFTRRFVSRHCTKKVYMVPYKSCLQNAQLNTIKLWI